MFQTAVRMRRALYFLLVAGQTMSLYDVWDKAISEAKHVKRGTAATAALDVLLKRRLSAQKRATTGSAVLSSATLPCGCAAPWAVGRRAEPSLRASEPRLDARPGRQLPGRSEL